MGMAFVAPPPPLLSTLTKQIQTILYNENVYQKTPLVTLGGFHIDMHVTMKNLKWMHCNWRKYTELFTKIFLKLFESDPTYLSQLIEHG